MEEKEKRIRALTRLYYSNPAIQQLLLSFGTSREVVPRYFEGFGKRPDTIQYPSDIMGLVNKGATSFHASEEIWHDPLKLSSEITPEEMKNLRKSWDLLIDIDSPFLDFSKIAARLLISELELYGIHHYGIKFSGSKGFHIIIAGSAFPREFMGLATARMFPEWPRAICEFLMGRIKPQFSKQTRNISDINAFQLRTNKKKEELLEVVCPQCGKNVQKDKWVTLRCDHCSNEIRQKKSAILRKRILRCANCLSEMEIAREEDFFECKECNISNISKLENDANRNVTYTKNALSEEISDMKEGLKEENIGGFDLVLVAPRHLFRMPYSLHEKTTLASIVLSKHEIEQFSPKDADPLKIKIQPFYPENSEGEGMRLLSDALIWKKGQESEEEKKTNESFKKYEYDKERSDIKDVPDSAFPAPIKKLLKGLHDGKKRGLFILITFLRSLNFPPEDITKRIREWNKLNEPPLKEGYIKSQLDWHFRQRKNIMPPNYENAAFYKDLGLIDKKQETKNPLVDVLRAVRKNF